MDISKARRVSRAQRTARVRRKISGTAERPRLCVARSIRHISAQIVDDGAQRTLAAASSATKAFAEKMGGKHMSKTEVSKVVGRMIAELAKEKGISRVVFDRRGFAYHGRVRALAEAARSGGLAF